MSSDYKKLLRNANIRRKSKVYMFDSRNSKELSCNPFDNFVDKEILLDDNAQEIYTLSDVAFYENNVKTFYTFRGFNISTSFEYDDNEKCFMEKPIDKKDFKRKIISQYINRIFGVLKQFTLNDFVVLFAYLGSLILITIMICTMRVLA